MANPAATGVASRPFVGREAECALLGELLTDLLQARPAALVLHGEAGVGKTRLLAAAVDTARERGVEVLRGTCVHFTTSVVPYGALLLALRSWRARSNSPLVEDLMRLLTAAEPARPADAGTSSMLTVLDDVLRAICSSRPVLLVVDDLQWADSASLDFLAYVLAGLGEQQLALLLAFRDEDRHSNAALDGWLSDTRRMPTVHQRRLDRLGPDDTGQLVAASLSRPTTPELTHDVYALTGGNAYFTELLVRHVEPDGRLPERLPEDLAEAVMARWRTLGVPARELTRLVALAGSPTDVAVLEHVVRQSAAWLGAVVPLLGEAAAAGVLEQTEPGRVWFRHPLLADLLLVAPSRIDPHGAHAAFAAAIEHRIAEEGESPALVAAAAVHHHAAGNVDAAFRWAVRAAAEAERLAAWTVADDALERACLLWPRVSAAVQAESPGLLALLRRAAGTARRAGALDRRLAYLTTARSCVDEAEQPLLASAVLIDWCTATFDAAPHGRQTILPEVFHALELTHGAPDSPERAIALAELAIARVWNDEPEPADTVDGVVKPGWAASRSALEAAQRSGTPAALARAGCAAGVVEYYDDGSAALTHLQSAYAYAAQVQDPLTMGFAAIYWQNYLAYESRMRDLVELCGRLSAEILTAGDPVIPAFLDGCRAGVLLAFGDWDECRRVLRPALAAGRLTFGGATASMVMSSLSTRTGDLRQAQAHVDRMLELVDGDWVGWALDEPIVELHLARGDPRSALAVLRDRFERVLWRDQQGDLHAALGASAAADLAQIARDRQDKTLEAEARTALDEMLAYNAELARDPRAHIDLPVNHRSWAARLAGEVARCRRDRDEPEAWEAAMLVNRDSGYRFDEALCGWRLAQSLLRGDGARSRANQPLRRAHELATGLGAAPLTREIRALARAADLNLQDVHRPAPEGAGREPSVLSSREREVLSHVGAGRTNAEIATALFISEKTASVHVSNILRKTGTRSRVEAAAWGRRTGVLPAEGE